MEINPMCDYLCGYEIQVILDASNPKPRHTSSMESEYMMTDLNQSK